MAASNTQRTLARLRKQGFRAEVVERWQPLTTKEAAETGPHKKKRTGYRRDLFKFIDVIALTPDFILGVQSCSYSTIAAHRRKILHDPDIRLALLDWLTAGGRFAVYGWRKNGRFWEVTMRDVTKQDIHDAIALGLRVAADLDIPLAKEKDARQFAFAV